MISNLDITFLSFNDKAVACLLNRQIMGVSMRPEKVGPV